MRVVSPSPPLYWLHQAWQSSADASAGGARETRFAGPDFFASLWTASYLHRFDPEKTAPFFGGLASACQAARGYHGKNSLAILQLFVPSISPQLVREFLPLMGSVDGILKYAQWGPEDAADFSANTRVDDLVRWSSRTKDYSRFSFTGQSFEEALGFFGSTQEVSDQTSEKFGRGLQRYFFPTDVVDLSFFLGGWPQWMRVLQYLPKATAYPLIRGAKKGALTCHLRESLIPKEGNTHPISALRTIPLTRDEFGGRFNSFVAGLRYYFEETHSRTGYDLPYENAKVLYHYRRYWNEEQIREIQKCAQDESIFWGARYFLCLGLKTHKMSDRDPWDFFLDHEEEIRTHRWSPFMVARGEIHEMIALASDFKNFPRERFGPFLREVIKQYGFSYAPLAIQFGLVGPEELDTWVEAISKKQSHPTIAGLVEAIPADRVSEHLSLFRKILIMDPVAVGEVTPQEAGEIYSEALDTKITVLHKLLDSIIFDRRRQGSLFQEVQNLVEESLRQSTDLLTQLLLIGVSARLNPKKAEAEIQSRLAAFEAAAEEGPVTSLYIALIRDLSKRDWVPITKTVREWEYLFAPEKLKVQRAGERRNLSREERKELKHSLALIHIFSHVRAMAEVHLQRFLGLEVKDTFGSLELQLSFDSLQQLEKRGLTDAERSCIAHLKKMCEAMDACCRAEEDSAVLQVKLEELFVAMPIKERLVKVSGSTAHSFGYPPNDLFDHLTNGWERTKTLYKNLASLGVVREYAWRPVIGESVTRRGYFGAGKEGAFCQRPLPQGEDSEINVKGEASRLGTHGEKLSGEKKDQGGGVSFSSEFRRFLGWALYSNEKHLDSIEMRSLFYSQWSDSLHREGVTEDELRRLYAPATISPERRQFLIGALLEDHWLSFEEKEFISKLLLKKNKSRKVSPGFGQ